MHHYGVGKTQFSLVLEHFEHLDALDRVGFIDRKQNKYSKAEHQ